MFFIGRMFIGVLLLGFILAIVLVFFIWSSWRKMKRNMRAAQSDSGKAYTSTGQTSQRYRDAQANSRYGSNSYAGPTAKRTYRSSSSSGTQSSSSPSSGSDVIEVPLLEVVDVSDDKQ